MISYCKCSLQNFTPAISYLRETFKYAVDVTSHAGRNVHHLFLPRVGTTYGKAGLYYKGVQIWNVLDSSLYAAATFKEFKHLYKPVYF